MSIRIAYLNPDYRRDPKTNVFCVRCQKDIKGDPKFFVHVIGGGITVLHPESEAEYAAAGPHGDDLYFWPLGPDCARLIGMEFCVSGDAFRQPTDALAKARGEAS